MRGVHFSTIVLLLALCGCSTVPFQSATGDLDKGLAATQSNLAALDTRDKVAQANKKYGEARTLDLAPCSVKTKNNSSNCALLIDGKVVQPNSAVPNGLLLAKALAQYGSGLDALATAKDLSDVNTALGNISTSAQAAAKSAGVALPGYAAPASNLLIYVFGQIAEFQRVQLIQSVLLTYGRTFDMAIAILQQEMVLLQRRVVGEEAEMIRKEINQLSSLSDTTQRRELTGQILSQQMLLQPLANQDVVQQFTSLRTAHAKLVAVAENPQMSLSDAVKAISDFYQKASALYDALHPSGGAKS